MRNRGLKRCGGALALPLWLIFGCVSGVGAMDSHALREQLHVQPGATCLETERLATEARSRLADEQLPAGLGFVVQGSKTDPRRAELQVLRGDRVVSRRSYQPGPAHCSTLHAAIGLAIALVIKGAQAEPLERAASKPPRAPLPGWSIAASGLLAYRWMPKLAPGLDLSLRRALTRALEVRVRGSGLAAFSLNLPNQSGRFDAVLAALRVEACAGLAFAGFLRGGLCVGMLGGVLHTVGTQAPATLRATVPYLALSGAVELELRLSEHWSWVFAGSPLYALHAVRVGLADAAGAQVRNLSLSRLSISGELGPLYRF